jgi:broad specificity phosphatase PhoE
VATTTFFLVRHGESTWNVERLIQGHADDAQLTPRGREQAAGAASTLRAEGAVRVVSSDLARASETAQIISQDLALPLSFDEGLRERHYGDLEGRLADDVGALMNDVIDGVIVDASAHPGGGESLEEFLGRSRQTLERLARAYPGERVIAVTHGGVIRVLRAAQANPTLTGERWHRVKNAEVWTLEVES